MTRKPLTSTLFPYTTLFRSYSSPVTSHLMYTYFNGNNDAKSRKQERSEEHTSELQSRGHLVCRLLLEKKKKRLTITNVNTERLNEPTTLQDESGAFSYRMMK